MTIHRTKSRVLWRGLMLALPLALLTAATACGDDDDASTDGGGDDKVTLGVMSGAAEETYADELGIKDVEVFTSVPDLFESLERGRVNAVALTAATVNWQVKNLDGFESTEGFVPEIDGEEQVGCGAFAFRYDDQILRDAFSAEMKKMQGEDEILPIVEEFGFTEGEINDAKDYTASDFAEGAYDGLTLDQPVDEAALQPYLDKGVTLAVANEAPDGFEDADGNITGAAPELGKEILTRLGFSEDKIKFTSGEFGELINGMNAGQLDITAAGMFINGERAPQALFADPDYCARTAFAVPEGNPAGLESFQDLVP